MSSTPASAPPGGVPISLETLPIPQLSQIKKQLDEELQHLTSSFQSLRGAQNRFRECVQCIATGLGGRPTPPDSTTGNSKPKPSSAPSPTTPSTSAIGKTILVPLTASLYVPGQLSSPASSSPSSSSQQADSPSPSKPTQQHTVLVDIGTGYYVDKSLPDALDFYTRKITDLEQNIQTVEKLVKAKGENVRMVEEVLRQKLFARTQKSEAQTAKA